MVAHIADLRRAKKKVVLASYSNGSRERLKGLLAEHGLDKGGRGRELAGGAGRVGASALAVIQLDHGFTGGDVALLTEQDMLGDRLVRRRKRRKSADAFLSELATLTPGDLVVHADHGIGRYEGLTQIPVAAGAARLRRALAMPAATSSTSRSRISTSSRATARTARA